MNKIMLDFPMPIVTPRLIMRPPRMGYIDAPEYSRAVAESINELRPWLPWAQFCPTSRQTEEYIRESCGAWILRDNNNVGLPLLILNRETNELIGHIVMWNIVWNIPKFEFGFWVRTSCVGNGYMTEAVNALTRYCFVFIGAKRIEIRCESRNIRSQQIPKKLGFKLDAVLHNNAISVCDNQLTDVYLFSRTDLQGLPELKIQTDVA